MQARPSPPDVAWRGLSTAEADALLVRNGPNELPAVAPPPLALRLLQHTCEPLSLVLLTAAVVSGTVLRHLVEAAAIAAIVVLNVAIASIEEQRADRAIAALSALTAPTARVRRDGTTLVVPARELVVGDLVEVAAGDRVPADALLLDATSLALDEAILTGESLPVDRDAGGVIRGGTLAVRGRALGVVRATGPATALGEIATALGAPVRPPLVRELRGVALAMSLVAVVLGAVMVPVAASRGDDGVGEAVLAGVALAIAAIPEGLATIVTLSLALGARAMAGRGAIVRSLPALETLGATTVICADKTGTLTTGHVTVVATRAVTSERALWRAALRCVDVADGTADPLDEAISSAATAAGIEPEGGRRSSRPFDAATRSMATITTVGDDAVLTVKGAPEVVLARCATSDAVDALLILASTMSADGLRVLAVAQRQTDDLDAGDLEPVGLLAFADPLRPSAADAVAACRRAGIRVVMVTGDHAATAAAIGRAVGLEPGRPVTGSDLEGVDEREATALLRAAPIVARVLPATKVALVRAHREAGEVVAMTGDGVNDAPALRAADIGVALAGEGGTDVAREAAGLVVTSGDLGVIVAAVREGRRIYRNVANVVGYLLTGNLSEIFVVAGALVVVPELSVPLLPVQLLWLNLVTDGLPALALGVDSDVADPLRGPPRRRDDRLLGGRRLGQLCLRAAVMATAVIGATVWARDRGWTDAEIRSELLLALLVTHVVFAYVTRSTSHVFEPSWWRSRALGRAVAGSLAAQLPLYLTAPGRSLLQLGVLPAAGWLVALAAALTAVVVVDVGRTVARHWRTS